VFLIRNNKSLSLKLRPTSKKTVMTNPEGRVSSFTTTTPKLPSASIKPVMVQGCKKFVLIIVYNLYNPFHGVNPF
jgi:hypothetical protein